MCIYVHIMCLYTRIYALAYVYVCKLESLCVCVCVCVHVCVRDLNFWGIAEFPLLIKFLTFINKMTNSILAFSSLYFSVTTNPNGERV